ncbi:MAG TPA: hypothetical protein VFA90_18770 [Terriglobales bacterium]|nr:hypothetical protein [Terriglobales bacterium]
MAKLHNHTERICLAEHKNIAAAKNDGYDPQGDDKVQNAKRSSEAAVRFADPLRQNSVLKNTVQHAICSDDRGIYSAASMSAPTTTMKVLRDAGGAKRIRIF